MVHGVFLEWLDMIRKEGNEYIGYLSKVYDDAAKVIRELGKENTTWKNKEEKWA